MAYFVEVYCRIAIRLCVGYFDDGRERYRTLNIWNVRRDVTADQVAAVVRALAPLLDGRIVRVLVIRKDRLVVGDEVKGTPSERFAPTSLAREAKQAAMTASNLTLAPSARELSAQLTEGEMPLTSLFFAEAAKSKLHFAPEYLHNFKRGPPRVALA